MFNRNKKIFRDVLRRRYNLNENMLYSPSRRDQEYVKHVASGYKPKITEFKRLPARYCFDRRGVRMLGVECFHC